MAPFSWPSGTAPKAAAEYAGFREIRLKTPSLPLVHEAGLEQAVRAFAATPVSPGYGRMHLAAPAHRVGRQVT